ncbi:MAG: hypothetical protein ACU837_05915 [Gammaproteobacteria bacterium]
MSDEENQFVMNKKPNRTPGGLDKIEISDDCFAPMTEEELALWYGGPIFPESETNVKIPPQGGNS